MIKTTLHIALALLITFIIFYITSSIIMPIIMIGIQILVFYAIFRIMGIMFKRFKRKHSRRRK